MTFPKPSCEPHLTPINAPNHRDPLHDAPTIPNLQTPTNTKEAKAASLLRSTARKLLSRQQLVGPKRHGQKLLQRHDRVLAELVVHQYRRVGLHDRVSQKRSHPPNQNDGDSCTYIAELADELPAHATRASRRRDVSGNSNGTEIASLGTLFRSSMISRCFSTKYEHTRWVRKKDISLTC